MSYVSSSSLGKTRLDLSYLFCDYPTTQFATTTCLYACRMVSSHVSDTYRCHIYLFRLSCLVYEFFYHVHHFSLFSLNMFVVKLQLDLQDRRSMSSSRSNGAPFILGYNRSKVHFLSFSIFSLISFYFSSHILSYIRLLKWGQDVMAQNCTLIQFPTSSFTLA